MNDLTRRAVIEMLYLQMREPKYFVCVQSTAHIRHIIHNMVSNKSIWLQLMIISMRCGYIELLALPILFIFIWSKAWYSFWVCFVLATHLMNTDADVIGTPVVNFTLSKYFAKSKFTQLIYIITYVHPVSQIRMFHSFSKICKFCHTTRNVSALESTGILANSQLSRRYGLSHYSHFNSLNHNFSVRYYYWMK